MGATVDHCCPVIDIEHLPCALPPPPPRRATSSVSSCHHRVARWAPLWRADGLSIGAAGPSPMDSRRRPRRLRCFVCSEHGGSTHDTSCDRIGLAGFSCWAGPRRIDLLHLVPYGLQRAVGLRNRVLGQCHTSVLESTEPKPPYVCPGSLITRMATI
jgi:hypothetical protein